MIDISENNPVWNDLTDRLNELGVENNDNTRDHVARFLATPGATLFVVDRPNGKSLIGTVVDKTTNWSDES